MLSLKRSRRKTVVVVIPFYDGAQWIERAVKSVASQTVRPDEFIVVNDGSKPEERAALSPLAKRYGFRILDKQNGGQGSARNAGVAASKSDFISLLDQDDFYLPHHIEDLLSALPENDLRLGYVYADLCQGNEAGEIEHTNMLRQQPGRHPKQGDIATQLQTDLFVLPSASLIRRSAFEAVGGFDVQFMGYEDDDLFLRMFRAGFTNYFLDKAVTVWCMRQDSTSFTIKMSRSRFKYFKKLSDLYPDILHSRRYFVRDCLMGRFADEFVGEAFDARMKSSDRVDELMGILREFTDIVDRNASISVTFKENLRFTYNFLSDESSSILADGEYPLLLSRSDTSSAVIQFYHLLFSREPSADELQNGVAQANAAHSLSIIAQDLESSDEFKRTGQTVGSVDESILQNLVSDVYKIYLARSADPLGSAFYVKSLRQGLSLSQLLRVFGRSDEFKSRHRRPFTFFRDRDLVSVKV